MKNTRPATLFSASFRGIFGRNRSEKFTTERNGGVEAPEGLDAVDNAPAFDAWLSKFAHDFARKIGAKRGLLQVTRYAGCEVYTDGSDVQVIPITQGVTVLNEKVGA